MDGIRMGIGEKKMHGCSQARFPRIKPTETFNGIKVMLDQQVLLEEFWN